MHRTVAHKRCPAEHDEVNRTVHAQNRRVEIGIVDTIIHYEPGIKN